MIIQECVYSWKYFYYKILKFEKNILLLITYVILIFKGEVKKYAGWKWKTR